MAKQNSFIELHGTLGKLTFYESEGKQLVRRKGSLNKDRLMNDPKFRRTRENMNEFGGAALVTKDFRDSLGSLITQLGDSRVTSRLTGLLRRICAKGEGPRGQRSFKLQANKRQFSGFDFNRQRPFKSVFSAKYDPPVIDANRSLVTWDIPSFNLQKELSIPEGTTHYQFVMATALLSDYAYDSEVFRYDAVLPEFGNKSVITYSDPLEVVGITTAPLTLSTDMELTEALPEVVTSVTVVGVMFFQESNGEMYDLSSAQALRIEFVA